MDFNIVDTLNTSLGPSIPPNQLEFYAGTIAANQFVANADLSRQLEIGLSGPTNLAVGVEFRREGYQIQAGEEGSYIDGGVRDQFGNPAIPGAQVFAGWRPSNERDESRHNVAAYVDVEGDVVPRVRLGLAGRVENYSDFGSTADGKITARFKIHDRAVIRGAASTGFRAPSLAPVELLGHEHELPEPRPGPGAGRGGDVPGGQRAGAGAGRHRPQARGVDPPERGAGADAPRRAST